MLAAATGMCYQKKKEWMAADAFFSSSTNIYIFFAFDIILLNVSFFRWDYTQILQ